MFTSQRLRQRNEDDSEGLPLLRPGHDDGGDDARGRRPRRTKSEGAVHDGVSRCRLQSKVVYSLRL